ncbi:uncharacterized protein LOC108888484 [Lates japonicus]
MADFATEQIFTEREERYLLTLVFSSTIPWNETTGSHREWPKRRIIKMEVSNLKSSSLTCCQIKSLAACLPSLQCGPQADDEHFDEMWHNEMFDVRQFSTTSQLNLVPPSAETAGAETRGWMHHQPDSSQSSVVVTPVHPDEIDIQTLANTKNHFNFMEFEGRKSVRITACVYSPDGRESQSQWRVSDYNLQGHMILSVICSLTTDIQQ